MVGETFTYKCSGSDYHVQTSGKIDYDFHADVRPYTCNDCKILTDVLVGERGRVFRKEKFSADQTDFYKCPKCEGDNIIVWDNKKKPCSIVGKMIKDSKQPIMMWD